MELALFVLFEAPPLLSEAVPEAPMRRVRMLLQGMRMQSSLSLPIMSVPFSANTPITVKTTSLMRMSRPMGSVLG